MKLCSLCKVEKPLADFNWRNKAKGWHRPECRACQSEAGKRAKAKDPAAHNARTNERKKAWRAKNPTAGAEAYASNIAKERARYQARSKTEAYRSRRDPYFKAWIGKNRDRHKVMVAKWNAANAEYMKAWHKEYAREYNATHREEGLERGRRRRAVIRGRTIHPFTLRQLDERMSVFGHRCAYCGGPFQEIDHVIPLARGGNHCLANFRPACSPCNRRKQAIPLKRWLAKAT